MRFINKSNRLVRWDDYIRNSKPSTWESSSQNERLFLHKHFHSQQNGLCIYCEQKIKSVQRDTANSIQPSHLEHILPKSDTLFATWEFEQDNLVMSCMGFREGKYELDNAGRVKRTKGMKYDFCGHPKDNNMDYDLFIDPLWDRGTHKYFYFDISGNILSSKKNPEKADYTIELLKLNHPDLVTWRLEVYDALIQDVELDITNHLATYPIFYSMVKYLWAL